jgi:hypothetical protein
MKPLTKLLLAAATLSVQGFGAAAAAEPPPYEIQKGPIRAAVGVPGKATVTVQAKNGWHVNDQAPITLTAKADPGVDLPKAKLTRADLTQSTKDAARFEIPFTATSAGNKTITAETRFVVCQEEACKPMKDTVALEVNVASAAPAAAAPGKAHKKVTRARTQ